jgi:spore maturation protein SpmA
MLNYVWLALIMLGLAAAISSDFSDKSSNKYKSGTPIPVEISFSNSDSISVGQSIPAKISISKSIYKSYFNENIREDFIINTHLTFSKNKKESTVYFVIDKNSPVIFQKMAKVNGKENDLVGVLSINDLLETKILKGSILFEDVSFIKMKEVTTAAIEYAENAVKIALGLIGIMAMWLGIMKIAEEAGIIKYIARALQPVTKFLFPDVPSDHPAMGSMIMNFSANFLGLSNAATPFGLKAMEELNKLNDKKDTATNAMCTFLAINTAGMTMIPATAIAIRASSGSSQPAIIIGTSLFGALCATIMGITTAKILEKFPIKGNEFSNWLRSNKKFLFVVLGIIVFFTIVITSGLFSLLGKLFSFINPEVLKNIIQAVSTFAIPFLILVFVGIGAIKKVKVYENFVEGAKEGFNVAIRIIPYLVAMLMAIGIFRAGGAMDWLIYLLRPFTDLIGMPAEALPMALMRPLSGSGSLGVMAETISIHGPDSFIGILVSTFYGSSETTFYVLAVYFGSVNIKKTRHALPAGLIADISGALGALFIVKLLFG